MRAKTITEALRSVLQSASMDLHVMLPGTVRSYDASSQTAEIELGVSRVLPAEDEDQSGDATEALPILPSVPVSWPRGGGCFLAWPLAEGDTGSVIFSESDLNTWRASGGVVDPGVATRHGLSGAVFLPGLHTRLNPLASADLNYGRVGYDGGPYIEFDPVEIRVGGSSALALQGQLNAHLAAIAADLATIAAGLTTPIPEPALQYGPVTGKPFKDVSSPIPTTITKGA